MWPFVAGRAAHSALLWSAIRAVCAERDSSEGVLLDAGSEAAQAAVQDLQGVQDGRSPGPLFEGELSGMALRQIVALSTSSIVMCFSTPENSSCQLSRDFDLNAPPARAVTAVEAVADGRDLAEEAAGAAAVDTGGGATPEEAQGAAVGDAAAAPEEAPSAAVGDAAAATAGEASGAAAGDAGGGGAAAAAAEAPKTADVAGVAAKLPALRWDPAQRFHSSGAGHLEVQRLSNATFVVCFDHFGGPAAEAEADDESPENHAVACSLGSVAAAGQPSEGSLLPFGAPLRLGSGRLVTVVARGNGRSFSVCARGGGSEQQAAPPAPPEAAEADPAASDASTAAQETPADGSEAEGGGATSGEAAQTEASGAAAATAPEGGDEAAEAAQAEASSAAALALEGGEATQAEAGSAEGLADFGGVACHWAEVDASGGGMSLKWTDETIQVQGF